MKGDILSIFWRIFWLLMCIILSFLVGVNSQDKGISEYKSKKIIDCEGGICKPPQEWNEKNTKGGE